jgi:4-amino-4-deoxy-L-arabinose transferase-like glycosyltransferase
MSDATTGGQLGEGGRRQQSVERANLAALLLGTGLLYLWDLGASGYANEFYSAAVQAGTQSWKAFFFGSLDAHNVITVDKPPAALWPMEIAGRIFGFNAWTILGPQAIEGVLAVWLLYATIKRWFGHWPGLLAGALFAITPVAVLMFRFNNPDALMTLLIVLAAYCTTRAIEAASTRWLLGAGAAMGFAFLAKGLQPFTVLPALALAYLVAAPTPLRRRLLQVLGAGAALVVGAGWWVLAVGLTPAADRPYIGGSGNNTALGLAFGYNGLDRLDASSNGPGGTGFSGSTGFGRLFNALNGGQISWLLPGALVAIVALLALTERRPRTDRTSAAMIIWAGWLLVTGLVLSFAGGIIHTYYSVELAPAIGAVVAIGAAELWRGRHTRAARAALAVGGLVTGGWTAILLNRTPSYHPWVSWLVLAAAVATAGLLIVASARRLVVTGTVLAGLVTLGGGSAAFALTTVASPHHGSVPAAGPQTDRGITALGPYRARLGGGRPPGSGVPGAGENPAGFPGPGGGTGPGGLPGGPPGGVPGAGGPGLPGGPDRPLGTPVGGAASVSSRLVNLLKQTDTTWAAATTGAQTAAPLELASGKAVIAIGGFSGTDPAPTLAQFERYVAAGQVRYFIVAGGIAPGGPNGVGNSGVIGLWVENNFTARTVGAATVYDLTKKARS